MRSWVYDEFGADRLDVPLKDKDESKHPYVMVALFVQ